MIDSTRRTGPAERETWLRSAIEILRPRFIEIGYPVPDRIRVAVGFGPQGGRQENAKILGVCLSRACSLDQVNEIWISPEDADTASMLATLIHELIHAALDNEDGHKGRFVDAMVRLGLEGKPTATHAGVALAADLITIAATLGEYPGSRVDLTGVLAPAGGRPKGPVSSGPKPQTNRHLKAECTADPDAVCSGYTVRLSRKWVELAGMPLCPQGHEMTSG
jgi:hypothetical protein